ncbi:MAG: RHS repeat-associated core domain-containing protein, partial [Bacteroidota bacterium]
YPLGNGTRFYLPHMGIFSSPDPLSPFDRGGTNPFRYVGGDPINYSDPSGNFALMSFLIGAAVGVAVAATIEATRAAISGNKFNVKRFAVNSVFAIATAGASAYAEGAIAAAEVGVAGAKSASTAARSANATRKAAKRGSAVQKGGRKLSSKKKGTSASRKNEGEGRIAAKNERGEFKPTFKQHQDFDPVWEHHESTPLPAKPGAGKQVLKGLHAELSKNWKSYSVDVAMGVAGGFWDRTEAAEEGVAAIPLSLMGLFLNIGGLTKEYRKGRNPHAGK